MPKTAACPRCGKKRLVGGNAPPSRLCRACYHTDLGDGRGRRSQPLPHQQFRTQVVAERTALYPKSSWWAVPDSQFPAAFAAERPRLQAIGAEARSTQSSNPS